MKAGAPMPRWLGALKREWMLYHLGLPEFRFMLEAPPDNEWVSLDCETTGLERAHRRDRVNRCGAHRGQPDHDE